MFHYFVGKLASYTETTFLINDHWGIQVKYQGNAPQGQTQEFFLYPYLDDNKKTIQYLAFDTLAQQQFFSSLLKITGIGIKTAMLISAYDPSSLQEAVQKMDMKFFQSIPGIGPKSAKKLILQLKDTLDLQLVHTMDLEQKLSKSIIKTLKSLGYETEAVKTQLARYEGTITQDNLPEVIKRLITQL